ncbi:vacuolar protein sorting-associated protein 8 homolog [Daktulosphaira vitifoliae]|uniref:vacuolar protein sorting-associated protein 8 homolog n=1 Tax=Daktulosphaira vitifoliae TaxID=58002 RepID=UPI0021A9DD71|nr:vacuolar protein sorting-associated protein 8 homolog [Daktulosphaira vitifoliae]
MEENKSVIDLLQSLDLELSEINDTEFNIPQLKDIPSVESILNYEDISIISEEDLILYQNKLKTSWYDSGNDSVSLGSLNSSNVYLENSVKYISSKSDPDRILRHMVLKPLSSQVLSFCDRFKAGKPSAIKLSSPLMVIGTTNGFIILFDTSQTFLWYNQETENSAVSALDFNHDCSRLLVGYVNGNVIMFDSSSPSCKILRNMLNVHTPNTAVLHLKFTDLPNLAVLSNSAGSVFELNFKRNFGIRSVDSKCLFSGGRGRVYCIEPLLFNQLTNHPMNGYIIIAMATFSKIIIVTIRPNTELLLSQNISSSRDCLPLLSWQFVVVQYNKTSSSSHRIMDPVLAFTRDDKIYFYQISMNEQNQLFCCQLQNFTLPYTILACCWMNARTLLTIDSTENVHLIDVRVGNEMEQLNISIIGIIYTSSYFIDSDINFMDKCCYSSVHGICGQLILLGNKGIHTLSIRSWIERLDCLIDKKLYSDALQLGVDFLEERGKAVLGLRGTRLHRHRIVKEKVIDILMSYIDSIVDINNPNKYKEGIPIIADICVHLQKTHLLFGRLWDGAEKIKSVSDIFLECLKNYLFEGQFDEVPTNVLQRLFEYLVETNQLDELEKCILNIKVECLDIDQSLSLVRKFSLYDALISIWTRALEDYVAPLQELVPQIEFSDSTIELGNKILVYLSCCLLGIAYPNRGDIPSHLQDTVRNNIVQFICAQHSIKASDNEDIYPYLRTLLKFNTIEFLNVLSMAFSDQRFTSQLKHRICCILLSLISNNNNLKSNQLGLVYAFVTKWQQEEGSFIQPNKLILEKITSSLLSLDQTTPIEERELAFIQLMRSGAFIDDSNLLKIGEQAKFFSVCREICSECGDNKEVFRYYILDNAKKHQVFTFISSKPDQFEQLVLDNLKELMDIDAVKCGIIFGSLYPHLVFSASCKINSDNQRYIFLKSAMPYHNADVSTSTNYLELLCVYEPMAVLNFIKTNNSLHLTRALTATKKAGLDNSTALLLERLGDFQGAFDLLFKKLQAAIEKENAVEECTEVLVALTQRGSAVLDPKATWLPILQCLLSLQSHDHLRKVLSNCDLNLTTEMHLLLNSSSGKLENFRQLIMGLIEKCNYELQMLQSTKTILHTDLHEKLVNAINITNKGVANPVLCSMCKQKIIMNSVAVFRCGHGFHLDCLGSQTNCLLCITNDL